MFKIIIMLLLAINYFWETFLTIINLRFIRNKTNSLPGSLPSLLQDKISVDDYKKSASYTKVKSFFSIFTSTFNLVIILVLICFSLLRYVDDFTSSFPLNRVFFCLAILFIAQVISLPFKTYMVFVIEKKFGFNKTTIKTFVLDIIKANIISIVIFIPLLTALFWFYDSFRSVWWILGFALFSLFKLLMLVIYPIFIAPLFNKFSPLEEGELLNEIKMLCEKIKFPLTGVFIMDGSKRSSHSNAYFTGIGKSKRIVLFDTLIKKLNTNELVSVLAHELGHFKLNHVKINLIISMCFSFLIFYLLNIVLNSQAFFNALGYQKPSIHIGIVLLGIVLPTIDMLINPLFNLLSRKHEYEADKFAIENFKKDEENNLGEALIKLNVDNLSSPQPHPLFSFIHYSHPPLVERLEAMEKLF